MKKRVISLLLCLIMALSLIPTVAFAAEVDVDTEEPIPEAQTAVQEPVVEEPQVQEQTDAVNEAAVQGFGTPFYPDPNPDCPDWHRHSGLCCLGWNYAIISEKTGYQQTGYKIDPAYGADNLSQYVHVKIVNSNTEITLNAGTPIQVEDYPNTAKVVISVDSGYYVAYAILCCCDGDGYNCQTAKNHGVFGQQGSADGSAVEMTIGDLRTNRHTGRGAPYYLMIMLKTRPQPVYVGYDMGSLSGFTGNVVTHSTVANATWVNDTTDILSYNTQSPSHSIFDISDEAKTYAANKGYTFSGWQLTYYNEYRNGTFSEQNTNYASSTVTIDSTPITLFTHAKMVAQWTKTSTTSITVKKSWDNKTDDYFEAPTSSITVKLLANGVDANSTVELNADNSWTGTFSALPITDTNSNKIVYTVEEVNVPSGYVKNDVSGDATNGYTIKNTAQWADTTVENKATLTIKKVGNEGKEYIPLSGAEFTLKNTASGSTAVTGKTNENGIVEFKDLTTGTYTLTETKAPNNYKLGNVSEWTVTVTDTKTVSDTLSDNKFQKVITYTIDSVKAGDTALTSQNGVYIISNDKIGMKSISVTKMWNDNNNLLKLRPASVTVNVMNGTTVAASVALNDKNSWKYTFTNLPETDGQGNSINYTVQEVPVTGYTSAVTYDSTKGYTITNTLRTVTVAIEKTVKVTGNTAPGSVVFTFGAKYKNAAGNWVELTCANNTIATNGAGTYTRNDMTIALPANIPNNGLEIVIYEKNDGRANWTYSTKQHTLLIPADVPSINSTSATLPSVPVYSFTNEYKYTYTPPTRPSNPIRRQPTTTTKPVESVKTGDMGIALYAVTSLLSLSGTALVIKKRKDEK